MTTRLFSIRTKKCKALFEKKLADDWLRKPRILHPWPNERFAVKYPR
jgi:hypothetical protein